MTGYTVNTGSNEKFSEGWDRIFSNSIQSGETKSKSRTTKTASADTKKTASGKPAKAKKST